MTDAYKLGNNGKWRNRIVRFEQVAPDQLQANPDNWRIHGKNQQDSLAGIFNEVGWADAIKVNANSGNVVDGHLRVTLALRNNEPTVPVLFLDLTDSEEKLLLATFDPITSMAETDSEILDQLLREVNTGDSALQALLSDMAMKSGLYGDVVENPLDEWRGMPEFEHEDKTAFRQLRINFQNQGDVDAFAELINQRILERTRSIWYPEAEIGRYADKRYTDES